MSIRSGEPLITVLHFCASCLIVLLPLFAVSGYYSVLTPIISIHCAVPALRKRTAVISWCVWFPVSDFLIEYFSYR